MALSGYMSALDALDGKFTQPSKPTANAVILEAQDFANQLAKLVAKVEQTDILGKLKHEPEILPLSNLLFVAETLDIPKATNFILTRGIADSVKQDLDHQQESKESGEHDKDCAVITYNL